MSREIGELIDAAALDPACWSNVSEGFHRFFPDVKVIFQTYDKAMPQPLPLVASGWEKTAIQTYLQYYSAINPWNACWFWMPLLSPVLSDDTLPIRALRKTEFYVDWLCPIGGADAATGIKIADDHGRMAAWAVHYDWHHRHKMHDALAPILRALAPRLNRALEANRATVRGKEVVAGEELIQGLRDAAMVVDGNCRLLAANRLAEEMLEGRLALSVGARDAVSFQDQRTNEIFSRFIHEACSRRGASTACSGFICDSRKDRLAVSILPVDQNLQSLVLRGPLPFFAPGVVALVILRTVRMAEQGAIAALQSQYGLTHTEARIAEALRGGGTLVEIAQRLGMAYETARTHLKAVFTKTGTRGQRELLAMILEMSLTDSRKAALLI